MIRALKVLMIVYGAILLLGGLADIVIPDQIAKMMGVEQIADYGKVTLAELGAIRVAAAAWVIVAGRDPVRHTYWVKFAITELLLLAVVGSYSVIRNHVDFMQGGGPLFILAAILAAALLAVYRGVAARAT